MVIRARDVRRTYGDVVALDGVSVTIPPGEVYALVGPNGAGKTTFVRALSGTTTAGGMVEVFGGPPDAVDQQRVGLLPQSFRPPDRLTARELIAYFGGLYERAEDPQTLLADVGLTDVDVRYDRLSGGQQRRVCLAIALVNDPDLLFLDEPTTGIDPAGRRAVLDLLGEAAAAGTTVFLTTHNMAEAERLADRVGILDNGRLVAEGTPGALVEEYGGPSRLEIRAGADAAAVLRAAGHAVEEAADQVIVRDVQPTAIGEVVTTLSADDVDYDALTWRQPGLEDVYLALAGPDSSQRGEYSRSRADRGMEAGG